MTEANARDLSGSKQSLRQAIGHLDDMRPAGTVPVRRRDEAAALAAGIRWPLIVVALALLGGGAAAALLLS